MIEYKYIDTKKPGGLKEAEELQKNGWVMGPAGFWSMSFSRIRKNEKETDNHKERKT